MLTIKEFFVEHRIEPIGIDEAFPSFSWILESDGQDISQTAYQLSVYDEVYPVWETGKVEGNQSIAVVYDGNALQAQTVYTVKLKVWANTGEHSCSQTSFETGMMNAELFSGKWITHTMSEDEAACPIFTQNFSSSGEIERARIYVSACGFYEISLNGQKVGCDLFAPGWTNYKKRIQYQIYDITKEIYAKNDLQITISNGWYNGVLDGNKQSNHYGDRVAAFAEIHIWYTDGRKEVITTNENWRVSTGEIRFAEFYDGETVDTTFKSDNSYPVVVSDIDTSKLIAQQCLPVRIETKLPPIALIHTPKGETVLDFGQNMSGFVELTVDGQLGSK